MQFNISDLLSESVHWHHRCAFGCSGFLWKAKNYISQLFFAPVSVVICMGLKEDFDKVRFEWCLHAWLLLLLLLQI